MGKNASKHVHRPCETESTTNPECFLVNAHLNKALEEQIWKKTTKTGYNLANYNMNQSLSELSICLEDKPENRDNIKDTNKDTNIPLKVELPPMKQDNTDTGKVFLFNQDEEKEKGEKEQNSRLNIEEFECGVHFGGGENSKQEWSFTLYDFDGHGKITKEDLVGLLKALYDAIGSSIKIPNNGTKTLKLRLSVGQDAGGGPQGVEAVHITPGDLAPVAEQQKEETEATKESQSQSQSPKKKDNTKKDNSKKDNSKHKDKDGGKDGGHKDSHKDSRNKDSSHKVKEFSRLNNLRTSPHLSAKCNNNEAAAQAHAAQFQASTEAAAAAAVSKTVRMGSHKHRELADLVQENMERNQIKQLRRHHSDCRGCHQEHGHHKRRHRGPRTTNAAKDTNNTTGADKPSHSTNTTHAAEPEETPKESQDRRNYYLDLAGVENTTSKFQQDVPTSALCGGVVSGLNNACSNTSKVQQPIKSASALTPGRFCAPRHYRSRSHELTNKKCDNMRKESEAGAQVDNNPLLRPDHLRSRSFDPQENLNTSSSKVPKVSSKVSPLSAAGLQKSRFRPVSLPAQIPETVSPHYHRRHRNREKDHDMAMQQVAEWIEREHTLDIEGDRIVIQRHEHHHVHEHHHHHHYHHYYEA